MRMVFTRQSKKAKGKIRSVEKIYGYFDRINLKDVFKKDNILCDTSYNEVYLFLNKWKYLNLFRKSPFMMTTPLQRDSRSTEWVFWFK